MKLNHTSSNHLQLPPGAVDERARENARERTVVTDVVTDHPNDDDFARE
jgi:hypothetical protein